MNRIYIAQDGNWGDAQGLRIVEVDDTFIQKLNDSTESEAEATLAALPDILIVH